MLTERELQILTLRGKGKSQAAIAQQLSISQAAVSQFETSAHRKILDMERQLDLAKELGVTTKKGIDRKRVSYRGGT
jgi:transcriptional regulator